jgi:hypothetical protein
VKLYVAGPITGKEYRNRPEFERVKNLLVQVGHDARIPHEFGEMREGWDDSSHCNGLQWFPRSEADRPPVPGDQIWLDWMWFDLHALTAWRPEGVVLLHDWTSSRGARLEYFVFRELGLRSWVNTRNVFVEQTSGALAGESWVFVPSRGMVGATARSRDLEFDPFGLKP